MIKMSAVTVFLFATFLVIAQGFLIPEERCEAKARTTYGWVCGMRRRDIKGGPFVSFKNVPYAKQPLGQLRFKELQPPNPWHGLFDATQAGPICPQFDVLYGPLMRNKNMSEACIHANIFVPSHALPKNRDYAARPGLPVFVFFHGGGFVSGSGDPDVNGPEYLIPENVILFTCNYRLGALGFLSLNSPSIPGNLGLKDALTFLRWVKANAKFFGGNPEDITIGGHSTGGALAHLLVLSKSDEGLFKRAILLSGVATRSFYSASPKHAQEVANLFISELGINENDPEKIHRQLINMPLANIVNATAQVQMDFAQISFCPVVEQHFSGIIPILDEDPDTLLLNGHGSSIPLLIGFTNLEGEFFIPNTIKFNTLEKIKKNPLAILSPDLLHKLPSETALIFAEETINRYFEGEPTPEKYVQCLADYSYTYPGIKLVEARANIGGAPAFLYQFSYNADFSAIKETKNIEYNGATHGDDLTFIFRINALKNNEKFNNTTLRDQKMRDYMVRIVKSFITCNNPTCGNGNRVWPAQKSGAPVKYENILDSENMIYSDLTAYQQDTVEYYDDLFSYVNQ